MVLELYQMSIYMKITVCPCNGILCPCNKKQQQKSLCVLLWKVLYKKLFS